MQQWSLPESLILTLRSEVILVRMTIKNNETALWDHITTLFFYPMQEPRFPLHPMVGANDEQISISSRMSVRITSMLTPIKPNSPTSSIRFFRLLSPSNMYCLFSFSWPFTWHSKVSLFNSKLQFRLLPFWRAKALLKFVGNIWGEYRGKR